MRGVARRVCAWRGSGVECVEGVGGVSALREFNR